MKRWRRAAMVFRGLGPFVVAFLRDRRRWIFFGRPRAVAYETHVRRAERLTDTIAALGPTFIKLAQVFSARADILPEPYLSAVTRLQDRVPPDAAAAIEAVLASELKRPMDELFDHFEREPVAAASLGQVHRASVEGRAVAVKVLRPHVEQLVALDLDISFRALFLLNTLFPNHHVRALTSVVREFSVRIREEMDFRMEARHIERFRHNFSADARVRAPEVFPEFTTRRVLVMEWIDGDKVDHLGPRFESGELSLDRLMDTLSEVYLRMMLIDGFLHADPHPGNILLDPAGRIVFIDWGMVVHLNHPTRDRLLRIALATGREDLDAMIAEMYELGMIDPDISRREVREAAGEILAIVERARDLGTQRVQEMVADILDTFYTWPLVLPQELVYFFRAAALLEGIGYRYDPDFAGLDVTRRVVQRMKGELLRAGGGSGAASAATQTIVRRFLGDAGVAITALPELLRRAEREELRVRFHPQDMRQGERFLLLQVRRVLLSIFALGGALIASITFVALRNAWILAGGLFVSLVFFVLVFLLPSHLLENPLRHARRIRPRGEGLPSHPEE